MPNFKLSTAIKHEITARAHLLTQRRLTYALGVCPLDRDEFQATLLPADKLATIHQLEADGIKSVQRHVRGNIAFRREGRDGGTPSLLRSVALGVELGQPGLLAAFDSCWGDPYDVLRKNRFGTVWRPDLTVLPAEKQQAFVGWLNDVVKAARLMVMTNTTVVAAIDTLTTTAEITAGWPALATLVEDTGWRTRFRNEVRRLHNYAPPAHFIAQYGKRMQAAETVLTGASMLDDWEWGKDAIRFGYITHLQLDNDVRFT